MEGCDSYYACDRYLQAEDLIGYPCWIISNSNVSETDFALPFENFKEATLFEMGKQHTVSIGSST